jgi:glycine/D-amino acid oxidase-like deaminating enzyme
VTSPRLSNNRKYRLAESINKFRLVHRQTNLGKYMHRRSFLGGAISAGILTFPTLAAAGTKKRAKVGIIGGGIIGASIAVHLIESGADVVIFEKNAPASGATQASLAWINPSTNNLQYRDLRLQSMAAWHELDKQLQLGVIWGGSISWTENPEKAQNLLKREAVLRDAGATPSMVDAKRITELCPYILPGETKAGFFLPNDGHVNPVDVTQRMISHAEMKGAVVIYPCSITGLKMVNGSVTGVETSKGNFSVDHLVVAAGADTPSVLSMAGFKLEMRNAPGLNVHTKPIPFMTKMVYDFSSALEFKQMPNGEAVVIYVGGPPKLAVHDPVFSKNIIDYPSKDLANAHAKSLLSKAAVYWPALANAVPEKIMVGFRPMPLDGLPVVGAVPGAKGIYVVATHSGVTLAPILGHYAAREILAGEKIDILAAYRPERFQA